jgi:6-phosphogluconolactonase
MKLTTICKDREQAAHALARRLGEVLSRAIVKRGKATLVVSGGTSPVRLFELLQQIPLDWSKVTVIPSDERLVPVDSDERNESMIRQTLITGLASDAVLVSLVSDENNPTACEKFANANLANLDGPFDAVVLGMGNDGHTASLFPDASDIEYAIGADQLCIVQDVPSQKRTRISLTPKALLNSCEINVLVFGDAKQDMLEKAAGSGPSAEFPIRIVLHQTQVPVTTYWAP